METITLEMPPVPPHEPRQDLADGAPFPKLPRVSKRFELRVLVKLALPIVMTMVSQQGMVLTDQVMVGQLVGSTEALAASSVGNTIFNLVWYVTVGASSALDTLGSNSWGAGDAAGLQKWACICLIVLTLMNVVGAVVLGLGEPISRSILHQSPEVSALVGQYCQWLIPGMFPLSLALALHKVLQVQGRTLVPMLITVACFLINIAGNAALITAFGFNGAPIATTVSRFCMLLLTVAYTARRPLIPGCTLNCGSISSRDIDLKAMFKARGAFMPLAFHGALMMGLEAASFDVTTAFAALLGEVEVSAHSAMINVIAFTFFSFPYGVAISSTIQVGNLLGAQEYKRARVSAWLAVLAGISFMTVCGIIILCIRNQIGLLFISDRAVVSAIASIAPLAAMFQLFDGTMGTAAGALRGMGKQKEVLIFNIIGLWCVGVVLGYVLTFQTSLELKGLWVGISSGVFSTAVLCVFCLARTDWPLEATKAVARATAAASPASLDSTDNVALRHHAFTDDSPTTAAAKAAAAAYVLSDSTHDGVSKGAQGSEAQSQFSHRKREHSAEFPV